MKDLIKKILKEEVKRTLNEQSSIQPSDFCPPIEGALTPSHSGYEWGNDRGKRKHAGVDYVAKDGDTIRTPYGGEVEHAIEDNGYGCGGTLVINHGDGVRTRYCHVSKFVKNEGDKVSKGEKVAEIGGGTGKKSDGNATGAHLHYEIHTNSEYSRRGTLNFSTSVDPESGWVSNLDCNDVIVYDDGDDGDDKEAEYQGGNTGECRGVLSTKEVRSDTLKLMKIYTNGFILNDNGEIVHELKFTPNSIENMDRDKVNAKGVELYATYNGLTDDGDNISIANGNIWVDCRLNSVVFDHINNNDIVYE